MFKKIKSYIIVAVTALSFGAPVLAPAVVTYAACDSISQGVAAGIDKATGDTQACGSSNDVTTGISSLATKVVNIFSIVVGVIAVLMIIYGGFKYITSGGDSNNVSGAKNTLIYALVGLIIVALAQFIVRVVLNSAANATT